MDFELTDELIKIICENVLTPVIYMVVQDDMLNFICFCDKKIKIQDLYETKLKIKNLAGKNAEIMDIREFDESERLDIISNAELIYSEHPLIEKVFAQSMMEDLKLSLEERSDVLKRHRESGTFYLQ